jgi:hypothetical protein
LTSSQICLSRGTTSIQVWDFYSFLSLKFDCSKRNFSVAQ